MKNTSIPKLTRRGMGVMYERGDGVAKDYAEAYKWYTLAAGKKQNVFGMVNREALVRRLTAEELAEGPRRARLFRGLEVAGSERVRLGDRTGAAFAKHH